MPPGSGVMVWFRLGKSGPHKVLAGPARNRHHFAPSSVPRPKNQCYFPGKRRTLRHPEVYWSPIVRPFAP
jgi:hypothetical protein